MKDCPIACRDSAEKRKDMRLCTLFCICWLPGVLLWTDCLYGWTVVTRMWDSRSMWYLLWPYQVSVNVMWGPGVMREFFSILWYLNSNVKLSCENLVIFRDSRYWKLENVRGRKWFRFQTGGECHVITSLYSVKEVYKVNGEEKSLDKVKFNKSSYNYRLIL